MFESVEDVAKWAETNGGEGALRNANAALVFGDGQSVRACIAEWLTQQEGSRRLADDDHQNSLRIREVSATESSATAAKRSAEAAEKAVRWAGWAVFLSVVAMFVSIFK